MRLTGEIADNDDIQRAFGKEYGRNDQMDIIRVQNQ